MKNIIITFLFLLSISLLQAQNDGARNKGNALIPKISFAAQLPGGHLEERFGQSLSFGLGLEYITNKNNWIIGLDFNYLFGTDVKEDVLANLRTPDGNIIGNDRSFADVVLRERGFYTGLSLGKLFLLSQKEKRSGIRFSLGAGLLQHKIRVQNDPTKGVPQLEGDYQKGYDRLTNGLALNQYIGYQMLSNDGRINFTAGFEFTQGFTKNRRNFNFDTQMFDDTDRKDYLYAFRVTWMIPFYFGKGTEDIYY